MDATSFVENAYATLVYYPEHKIIHHTFHRPNSSEQFRSLLLSGLEALKAHGAQKWLSDDRANSALSEEDTQWVQTVWFPQVVAAGWKSWALVVPEDTMARLNLVEHVNFYHDRGIRVMVFTDPSVAMNWLLPL